MAKDYSQLAKDIVRLVGTEENVTSLTHCITRLRFKLKDESKADTKALSQLNGVIKVMQSGGQYQVVIGQHVGDVYDAIGANTGVKLGGEVDANEDGGGAKGNILNRLIDILSGIFMPLMPAMSAVGILKAILVMCTAFGWVAEDNSTYRVLYQLADGFFTLMPIFLAYSAAKKFKCNPFVAMCVGAGLCLLTINAADAPSYFGIKFTQITYTNSVMPIVLSTYLQSKIEKPIEKFFPKMVASLFTGMIVAIVCYSVTILAIGPLTDLIGRGIANGLNWVLDKAAPVAGFLIAFGWPFLIIFGMHWGFIPIIINNMGTMGYDVILPITVSTNFAVGTACLAVFLKTRDKELKGTALASTASALLGGITEPGIYGVLLKYKRPFLMMALSCGVGGVIAAMAHLQQPILLTTCLITIPAIGGTVGWMDVVALGVGSVLAFILTYFFGFNDKMIIEE